MFRPWTTGLDTSKTLQEGLHVIAPWNKVFVYDIREQSIDFFDKADEYSFIRCFRQKWMTNSCRSYSFVFRLMLTKFGSNHERFWFK
jgi:hypothetical protein